MMMNDGDDVDDCCDDNVVDDEAENSNGDEKTVANFVEWMIKKRR